MPATATAPKYIAAEIVGRPRLWNALCFTSAPDRVTRLAPMLLLAVSGCLAVGEGDDRAHVGTSSSEIVAGHITQRYPVTGQLLMGSSADHAANWCTATLVGCRTVVTAAHCVCVPDNRHVADCPIDDRLLFFQHAGFFAVDDVAVHPSYHLDGLLHHDIAVVTLAKPVSGIAPARLASTTATGPATIVGFGRSTGTGTDYGIKRFGDVILSDCSTADTDESHVCWSGPADMCNGDSGGSLLTTENGRQTLQGVHSWIRWDEDEEKCTGYNIDANVAADVDFIRSIAGDDLDVDSCGPLPPAGDDRVAVTSRAAALSAGEPAKTMTIEVPPGTAELRIALNGEDMRSLDPTDFDLLVGRHTEPTADDNVCARTSENSNAYCEFRIPEPGTWYAAVSAKRGGGIFQLTASTFPGAPITAVDVYSTADGVVITTPDEGVLANDTDDAELTVSIVRYPEHGTLFMAGNGSFAYQADDDFAGMDWFTYRADNGNYGSADTRVEVWIEMDPDDPFGVNEAGGCGTTSSTGGPTALFVVLLAALPVRRRRR